MTAAPATEPAIEREAAPVAEGVEPVAVGLPAPAAPPGEPGATKVGEVPFSELPVGELPEPVLVAVAKDPVGL
jgi:hypothetical protein